MVMTRAEKRQGVSYSVEHYMITEHNLFLCHIMKKQTLPCANRSMPTHSASDLNSNIILKSIRYNNNMLAKSRDKNTLMQNWNK